MGPTLHAAVPVLLATSGALYAAAAAERWWPACVPGRLDAAACLRLQDHLYDPLAPTAPWTPVGEASLLVGAALVCLALAAVLLPRSWGVRHAGVAVATAIPAAAVAVLGVASVAAGSTGVPVPVPGGPGPAVLVWCVGLPLALLAAMASAGATDRWTTARRALVVALLSGANPVVELLAGPVLVGYTSHDATPWAETLTAGLLLAAAVVAWPARSPRGDRLDLDAQVGGGQPADHEHGGGRRHLAER